MLLDVSDRDGVDEEGAINLQSWPIVKGMYMPDAITTFKGKADGKRCKFRSDWGRPAPPRVSFLGIAEAPSRCVLPHRGLARVLQSVGHLEIVSPDIRALRRLFHHSLQTIAGEQKWSIRNFRVSLKHTGTTQE